MRATKRFFVDGNNQKNERTLEVAGKATGDTKLESEGKGQKIVGKVQNTIAA